MAVKTIFRSKVFLQYFLSYTLILLIPLLVFGYFYYTHTAKQLQAHVENSIVSEVANMDQRVNSLRTSILSIANLIGQNATFARYRFTANEYNMMLGIELLSHYQINHPDLFDILLYYRGEDRIFSATGVSSLQVLASSRYQYENWNPDQLKHDLNEVDHFNVRTAEQVRVNRSENMKMLTILVPIGTRGSPHGTVMFLVRVDQLFGVAKEWVTFNQATIYLLNEQQQPLAAIPQSSPSQLIDFWDPERIDPTSEIWTQQVDGQKYTFVGGGPATSQWSVLTVFPTNVALVEIGNYKQLVERMLIAVLVIGIISGLALAFYHYFPVRKMTESILAQTLHRIRPSRGSDNELAMIQKSLDQMIEDQAELVKEEWVERLLRGEATTDQIEVEILQRIQGHDEIDAYFVILVNLETDKEGNLEKLYRDRAIAKQHINSMVNENWKATVLDLLETATFAVLVCLRTNNTTYVQSEVLQSLDTQMKLADIPVLTISSGSIVNQLEHINRSYIEALTAMEYRIKYGSGSVIRFEDIDREYAIEEWYPLEEQMKYLQSLKQGDEKVALESLGRMIQDIREREQSLLILKSQCYEIVTAVFKTVKELRMSDYAKTLEHALSFESLDDLERQLVAITIRICQEVRSIRESGSQVLIEDIEQYLQDNFNSITMSLEAMAGYFKLSPPYLSRLIKEKSGKSFTDWVTELKLNYAKQLLIQSKFSIREISERAGYVDYPNFMRRFKKVEGITPGAYRKLYQDKSKQ